MIQTTIIPENTSIIINIPNNNVGKKVHTLIYIDDEITTTYASSTTTKKVDDLELENQEQDEKKQLLTFDNRKHKTIEVSPLVESLTGVIPNISLESDEYHSFLTKKHS